MKEDIDRSSFNKALSSFLLGILAVLYLLVGHGSEGKMQCDAVACEDEGWGEVPFLELGFHHMVA
jgi:hypothetical protein